MIFLVLTLKYGGTNSVPLAFLFFSTDFTGSESVGLVKLLTSSNMRSEAIFSTGWSRIASRTIGSEGVVSLTYRSVVSVTNVRS